MPIETVDRCPAPPGAGRARPDPRAAGSPGARSGTATQPDDRSEPGDHEGWQALALAERGRLLNAAELAAVRHLPADIALDLLFPDLSDPARHEALWALG